MALLKLFLDDYRVPAGLQQAHPGGANKLYLEQDWKIVKTYEEFQLSIENKLPDVISFDHDLTDEHTAALNRMKQLANPRMTVDQWDKQYYEKFKKKTGWHAAKWLTFYCVAHSYPMPLCFIHTSCDMHILNLLQVLDLYESKKAAADRMMTRHGHGSEDDERWMKPYSCCDI